MQAARGASLTNSDDDGPPSQPSRRRLLGLFATVAVGVYLLDLLTKTLALERLEVGSPVNVLGDWFRLTLVFNPGAAFSLGTSATVFLSLFAIVAAGVVLYVARSVGDRIWAIGLGLLLGGILGNLTDRLFREPGPLRGHVVDMFQVPNWPVFNVADICINLAAGIIVLQAFRGISHRGGRHEDHA
jgi:signal peptidase II